MKIIFSTLLILVSYTCVSATQSPYAGHEQRGIKALSQADIEGYLAGSGMGYAKAAELNHYPGPRHVLELATQLELNEQQMVDTGEIFKVMQHRAVELGRQLVEKEGDLDHLFASGTITSELLKNRLDEIATLRSEIRFVHLVAHLEQKAVLSADQAQLYDQLRGYAGGHGNHNH